MKPRITKVWIDETAVYIQTDKGEIFSEQFADYARLRHATPAQRADFEYDNIGIRWEKLDEDLCFDGFMHHEQAKAEDDGERILFTDYLKSRALGNRKDIYR